MFEEEEEGSLSRDLPIPMCEAAPLRQPMTMEAIPPHSLFPHPLMEVGPFHDPCLEDCLRSSEWALALVLLHSGLVILL